MRDKIVSVIIPAYNSFDYIERCLESICNQTYKNIQIIIIDDGSTDETFLKIMAFAKKDERIITVFKENGGVSSARNIGLRYANGDYICFVDTDDELENEAIENLVCTMENEQADCISFQYSKWDEYGERLDDVYFRYGDYLFNTDRDRISFIMKEIVPYNIGGEVWSKLFKRDIIEKNHILFPENCHEGEDYAFTIKYFLNSSKITCISDRLYRYNKRKGSAMNTSKSFETKLSERVLMLKDVWEYLSDYGNTTYMVLFPLLFMMFINNTYIGHSAIEVVEYLKKQNEIEFIRNVYQRLPELKKEYYGLDDCVISRIRYRYHIYINSAINGFSLYKRIILILYNIYRQFKGLKPLEKWIMPY